MRRFHPITLAAVLAIAAAAAADLPPSSLLQVNVPQTLFRPDGYKHQDALFGPALYGSSIAGNVYYTPDSVCYSTVDKRKGYPTRATGEDGIMEPFPTPYILLVDRGDCTFVKKVRNAQRSGAAGVVIADNNCLCSDKDCASDNDIHCQELEPIMADDGTGGDISIPSFLMLKKDADEVKAELRANHTVQIEMQWFIPNPDARVEYELWTIPSDIVGKDFQKNFKPVAEALGDHAYFSPHMYIYDGIKSNCQGVNGENMCFNLCTNNGRYCATDPDNDLDHGISGADVVKESLRRICIWNHFGEQDGIGSEWWEYISQFSERCDSPDLFASEQCIDDAYKHAGIKRDVIERCIEDSGGLDKDGTNSFLELELQAQVARNIVISPAYFVNTVALRGAPSVSNVFTAICSGYVDGSEPSICTQCSTSSTTNVDECIRKNTNKEEEEEEVPDFLTSFLEGDDFADGLVDCGVDVEDLTAKAFSAILMSGTGGGGMLGGPGPMIEEEEEEEERAADPSGIIGGGLDAIISSLGFNPFTILSALRDDDEGECTAIEMTEVVSASSSYLTCSGVNQFFDMEAVLAGNFGFPDSLVSGCYELMGMAFVAIQNPEDLDLEDVTMARREAAYKCGKAALGDNPVGNYIRYAYQNMDKILECMINMAEALPHCVLGTREDNGTPAVAMPLSLDKKLFCLVRKFSPMFAMRACFDMYGGLDECLPDVDEIFDGREVRDDCLTKGAVVGYFEINDGVTVDSSVLTSNRIPDYCLEVIDNDLEINTAGVFRIIARYDYYNANREYGWTIGSLGEDASEEVFIKEEDAEEEPYKVAAEKEIIEEEAVEEKPTAKKVEEDEAVQQHAAEKEVEEDVAAMEEAKEQISEHEEIKEKTYEDEAAEDKIAIVLSTTKKIQMVQTEDHENNHVAPPGTPSIQASESISKSKWHPAPLAAIGLIVLAVVSAFVFVLRRRASLPGREFSHVSCADDLEFAESDGEMA